MVTKGISSAMQFIISTDLMIFFGSMDILNCIAEDNHYRNLANKRDIDIIPTIKGITSNLINTSKVIRVIDQSVSIP